MSSPGAEYGRYDTGKCLRVRFEMQGYSKKQIETYTKINNTS
jgi:hypothetical protein